MILLGVGVVDNPRACEGTERLADSANFQEGQSQHVLGNAFSAHAVALHGGTIPVRAGERLQTSRADGVGNPRVYEEQISWKIGAARTIPVYMRNIREAYPRGVSTLVRGKVGKGDRRREVSGKSP